MNKCVNHKPRLTLRKIFESSFGKDAWLAMSNGEKRNLGREFSSTGTYAKQGFSIVERCRNGKSQKYTEKL